MMRFYSVFLAFVLLGYALLGKGFAYTGYSNIYIGEILLFLGVVVSFLGIPTGTLLWASSALFKLLPTHLLLAFLVWGILRTVPYLPEYEVMALRDAVVWGYGVFAVIVGVQLLSVPSRIKSAVSFYRVFANAFITLMPILWFLTRFYRGLIPTTPFIEASIPLVYLKPGDVLVHLSGVAAFIMSGLLRPTLFRIFLVGAIFLLFSFENRGGTLAFISAMLVVLILKPLNKTMWKLLFSALLLLSFLWITGVQVDLGRRSLSFQQISENLASIWRRADDPRLESTKEWRLEWWARILEYTLYGEFLLAGKGYGVNLADEDGFQVFEDGSLRSPHNIHLNILARSGIVGLAIWLMLQLSWAALIVYYYLRSRFERRVEYSRIFLFLLAYWVAFMVNASFDVFLEGPVGGIWFWCLFGVGLAIVTLYQRSGGRPLLSNSS